MEHIFLLKRQFAHSLLWRQVIKIRLFHTVVLGIFSLFHQKTSSQFRWTWPKPITRIKSSLHHIFLMFSRFSNFVRVLWLSFANSNCILTFWPLKWAAVIYQKDPKMTIFLNLKKVSKTKMVRSKKGKLIRPSND